MQYTKAVTAYARARTRLYILSETNAALAHGVNHAGARYWAAAMARRYYRRQLVQRAEVLRSAKVAGVPVNPATGHSLGNGATQVAPKPHY
jgi:hypothetical protein